MTRKIIGVWLALNLIALPFPTNWLPNVGQFISNLLFPANKFICRMFGEEIVQTFGSDSIIYFVQSILLFTISSLAMVVVSKTTSLKSYSINYLLQTVLSYLLFLFLFKYGIDKLFQHQFYTIEPNIAHTPIGSLSKDILFWSSMSSSEFYNVFMGLIEVTASVLLLFHRTRLLGGIISIGIMSNVLAINIGFDISVKLLSTLLLLSSIYVTTYYRNIFMIFLGRSSNFEYPQHQSIIKNGSLQRGLKGTIIALFLFESLLPFVSNSDQNETPLYGSFEISSNVESMFSEVKRIHFTSSDYLVLEDFNSGFTDYKTRIFDGTNQFEANDIQFTYIPIDNENLKFQWIENRTKHEVLLTKIKLEKLPVYQDQFHLTLESYYD